jgi:hypothetical protein
MALFAFLLVDHYLATPTLPRGIPFVPL